MSELPTLPPKTTIDTAIEFLGIKGEDNYTCIKDLLNICEYDGLTLYFDYPLDCIESATQYGNVYTYEDGIETGVSHTISINREDIIALHNENEVAECFRAHKTETGGCNIIVSSLRNHGRDYLIYKNEYEVQQGVEIDYKYFYLNRDDLFNYRKRIKETYSQSTDDKSEADSEIALGVKIIDKRLLAFKYWLVGNSGKSIHNPEDLQAAYQDMGEPTRDEVWGRLQLMDKTLFSSGKHDFLKAISKNQLIKFKGGTSIGR